MADITDKVEAIVRKAISRAQRADVDPIRSFKIEYRLAEKDAAVAEAVSAIAALTSGGEG